MKTSLDGFLDKEGEPAPEPEEQPVQAEAETKGEQPPEAPKAEPDAQEAEDGAPPAPDGQEGGPTIPRSAFIKAREDWKAKAVRAETEAAEFRRQLEEFKKAPPPAPAPVQPQYQAPPAPQLPDPEQNPVGYITALMDQQRREAQQMAVAERFNFSEMRWREKLGDAAVDALTAEFRQAVAAEPTLEMQLHQQRDPYGWWQKQSELRRLQREIGSDPSGYETRLREKIMAEMQAAPPQVQAQQPPAALPRQAPSLAGVRTAGGRSDVPFTGPTPLGDVLRR